MIKNFFVLLLIGAFILCPLVSAVTLEEIKQYATGEGNVTTICYNCTYNATGPKGDPGDPGPAGPAGANASVTINQTRTGDPGSQAQVINLGDLQDLILDFVIPKGDPGDKGDKGDTGDTGPQGVNGTPGSPGPQGVNGTPGIQGPQGDPGTPGINGTDGINATARLNASWEGAPGSPPLVVNVGIPPHELALDITLPPGIMNQTPNMTSAFVGSQWYDHNIAVGDIAGYNVFNRSAPTDGEGSASASVTSAGGEVLLKAFATYPGDPAIGALPAGDRIWYTYAKVDSEAGGNSYIHIYLYKRHLNGTETLLYDLTTGALKMTTTADMTTESVPADIPMDTTDRFVAKYYAKTDSAAAKIVTLYFDGTTHVSKASSPIAQGIQGEKGDKGDPGLSANVSVNKTFTGDPGTEASVINIGDTVNVSLDVTIPRGYNGTDASINQSAFLMVNGTNAMEADLNAGMHRVINIVDPDALTDAATKNFVLISIGNITFPAVDDGKYLWVNGTNVMQAILDTGGYRIQNVSDPLNPNDAVNKNYADVIAGNASSINNSYLLRDGTLPMTGDLNMSNNVITGVQSIAMDGTGTDSVIYRLSNGTALRIDGGKDIAGSAGKIELFGNTWSSEAILFKTWNYAKTADIDVAAFQAATVSGDPYLDMFDHAITGINYLKWGSSTGSIATDANTQSSGYSAIYGGNATVGSGSIIVANGADRATNPGDMYFYVPSAAKTGNIEAMVIQGSTDTPYLDMSNNQIKSVANVTTLGDALPYIPWTAWTPTETWGGGTPASSTRVSRYQITGKTCTFSYYFSSADSNGATSLKITLPVARASIGAGPALTGIENYGAAGATYANPLPYIAYTDGDIQFLDFKAATDGQRIRVWVSGSYEI